MTMGYHSSHEKTFESILLCSQKYMDHEQGTILWWCPEPDDIQAWPINSVCLSAFAKWEDVKHVKDWICTYKAVLAASPDRSFIDKVREHVPWLPILSPRPDAFGSYKSVAQLVEACGTAELERRLMYGVILEPSSGLLNLADIKPRNLLDVPRTLSGFKMLDKHLGGFRDGELTVWTGKRGEGKSTITGQILLEAVDQGHKVCAYSGELDGHRFKAWIIAQAAGPGNLEELQDPQTGGSVYIVPDGISKMIDEWWDRKFYLYNLSISSAHDEDSILAEFEYAHRCLNCNVFLTDNAMSVRFKNSEDYYRAQSAFVNRLADFAKTTETHVHLISHPRKLQSGKHIEDSDEISGSGDISNYADNVISVRRLPEPDIEDGHDAELTILKTRENGIKGKIGLCFDVPSRRFYDIGGSPDKKYGWEYMGKQEFAECEVETPFDGCD